MDDTLDNIIESMFNFFSIDDTAVLQENVLVHRTCTLKYLEVKINILLSATYFRKVQGKKHIIHTNAHS